MNLTEDEVRGVPKVANELFNSLIIKYMHYSKFNHSTSLTITDL